MIKNNQYPKTLQEAVDVMHKVKFKPEKKNGKINIQKQNKNGGVERDKSNKMSLNKQRNIKNYYCCGSGMHMLDNCDIIDTISRDQWFDRIGSVQSHHQQAQEKIG